MVLQGTVNFSQSGVEKEGGWEGGMDCTLSLEEQKDKKIEQYNYLLILWPK